MYYTKIKIKSKDKQYQQNMKNQDLKLDNLWLQHVVLYLLKT